MKLYVAKTNYQGTMMYFTDSSLRENVEVNEIKCNKKNLVEAILWSLLEENYTKTELVKKTKIELMDLAEIYV